MAISSLKLAFFLNFAFSCIEVYGGLYTNSVAILSDALHDFGDSIALGLAWYLEVYSQKASDSKYSYGYKRFSLLSALINIFILTAGSIYLFYESVMRITTPEKVHSQGMIGFAILGLLVNGYGAWKVSKHHTQNHQAVFWHLLEDVLGWAAVLVAAILIMVTGKTIIDPILSCLINLFVLFNVLKRVREIVRIFLQGVPSSVDLNKIQEKLKSLPLIVDIHAIQAWSLDGDRHFLNCHVIVSANSTKEDLIRIKKLIKTQLREHKFLSTSIEFEFEGEDCQTD